MFGMLLVIANILSILIQIFLFLLIARAVLSWVNPDPSNAIVQFINSTTDPILYRVRQRVPPLGMFDLSLIIVILALYFIDGFVVGSLRLFGGGFVSGIAVLGQLLITVANILAMILQIFIFLFIARAVLTLVNPDPSNPIVQFIRSSTEPFLYRLRRRIPSLRTFALSELLIIVALVLVNGIVLDALRAYGSRLVSSVVVLGQ